MNEASSGDWRRAWQDLAARSRSGECAPAPAMPHVRGRLSVDRVLGMFVVASLPAAVVGVWAAGRDALAAAGGLTGWRADAIAALGARAGAGQAVSEAVAGLSFALPLLAMAWAVAAAWETIFAALRRRPTDPGWIMTGWLFAMLLPASTPLWQAALGLSFGLVLGCHIFGGTGRYLVSPAVLGALFLRLAYPVAEGPALWQAPLTADAGGWWSAAVAGGPGGLGTASALACAFGAAVLAASRVASWRTLLGAVAGLSLGWAAAAALGDPMPLRWHAALGGLAFCWAFTLTDPTTLPLTRGGRWAHGALFGLLVIAIREADPTRPEGSLTAVLTAALCVPLIDYAVLRWHRARGGGRLEVLT